MERREGRFDSDVVFKHPRLCRFVFPRGVFPRRVYCGESARFLRVEGRECVWQHRACGGAGRRPPTWAGDLGRRGAAAGGWAGIERARRTAGRTRPLAYAAATHCPMRSSRTTLIKLIRICIDIDIIGPIKQNSGKKIGLTG